jgi:hypothetical protein
MGSLSNHHHALLCTLPCPAQGLPPLPPSRSDHYFHLPSSSREAFRSFFPLQHQRFDLFSYSQIVSRNLEKLMMQVRWIGKFGWFTMEILSPLTLLWNVGDLGRLNGSTKLLVGMWLVHYVNRAVVQVLLSKGMA